VSKKGEKVKCSCPRCQGAATADPKWGFDLAKVPGVHCMMCDVPIGSEAYRLETGLARFGQMQFLHERCAGESTTNKNNNMKNDKSGIVEAVKTVAGTEKGPGQLVSGLTSAATGVKIAPVIRAELRDVGLEELVASKTNPRKVFSQAKLEELAASIRIQGIVQPLIVRAISMVATGEKKGDGEKSKGKNQESGASGDQVRYEVVAGERRLRAARMAGLKAAPCLIRTMSDDDVVEVQQIENLQREDLTVLEEAEGFKRLIESKRFTAESLAERLGVSRGHVFNRLRLARSSEAVQKAVTEGGMPASLANLVCQLPPGKLQTDFLKEIKGWDGEWESFREAKEVLEREFVRALKKEDFDLEDGKLVSGVPSCSSCPKRTGNMPGVEGKSANVCTDVECHRAKLAAWGTRKLEEVKLAGGKVLEGKEAAALMQHGRIRGNTAYVNLDEEEYIGNSYRSYRKALGKRAEASKVVMVSPENGKLMELIPRKELPALLKEAGVKKESSGCMDSYGREQRARAKKNKELRPIAKAVLTKCMEAVPKMKGQRELMEWLVAESLSWWTARDFNAEWKSEAQFRKYLSAANERQLLGLLVQAAVEDGMDSWRSKFSDGLVSLAKVCGVDAQKIQKEMAKAVEAKAGAAKGKGKTAKRK
jgi:ParB/RepB/Spo0J family partition protein